jgi:hypothetical protein
MKKLLIIILLLFSFNAFGQVYFSGTRQPLNIQRAEDFFARCVTAGVTLTESQKRWYNDSIFVPLLDSGLIGTTRAGDSIQALWCFALFPNGSANVAVLNLLSDSNTCLAVNSPTFTDSGVVGNGTSSYLNTNCNPLYDSTIMQIYSRGMGLYSVSDRLPSETKVAIGFDGGSNSSHYTRIFKYNKISPSPINFVMGSSYTAFNTSDTNSLGFYYSGWNGSLDILLVKKGINKYYLVNTSNAAFTPSKNADLPYYILCYNNAGNPDNYDDVCITFAFMTDGLCEDSVRKLSNILNNSLKGRGYNVY